MSQPFRALDDQTFVFGQIQPEDLARAGALGVVVVINHRPDDEEPGQPTSLQMAEAASAAGIAYLHAPTRGLPDATVVVATADVLAELKPGQKVLMFCKSGMRSSAAWALAQASLGLNTDVLKAKALEAGYDLGGLPL